MYSDHTSSCVRFFFKNVATQEGVWSMLTVFVTISAWFYSAVTCLGICDVQSHVLAIALKY